MLNICGNFLTEQLSKDSLIKESTNKLKSSLESNAFTICNFLCNNVAKNQPVTFHQKPVRQNPKAFLCCCFFKGKTSLHT